MFTVLRKGVLLSVLFALCFTFVACDSSGSDGDSSPEWAGQWEVVSFEEGPPSSPNYWDISESELQVYQDSSGTNTQCNSRLGYEVADRDGNIVTFLGNTPNAEGETIEFRFEVSGETMTATVLDASDEEEAVGGDITLSKIDNIPLDSDNCDIN